MAAEATNDGIPAIFHTIARHRHLIVPVSFLALVGVLVVPLRLQPGDDLRGVLEAWMGEQQEQAGCLISAVGSLSLGQLRLAGASEATAIHGELEILSLSGTLSPDGAHLHIAIADSKGAVIGGHLCAGCLVRTTVELVIGLLPQWRFCRQLDPATGHAELRISPQAPL